ncbi:MULTISPECIES: replication/maintenance protein RepL [unclassified Pseudomonas]|uniref:replication/maintenance protein RepL n=1 Tax=unclassified Pseudomonas TaxID=196821 RepID=UPI001E4BD738|nr:MULTISPECIES: replication/maintenance protein RepL [unclassified Pseudomonas]MDH1695717.1 replication/maintenance protein RepL [Pseudomonas sp. GD03766]UFH26328.1 replication/maintenance protein RepL [Pseudomonas sp. CIP-10]
MDSVSPAPAIANFISINRLVIDKRTGEIMGYDDKPSVLTAKIKYQQELGKCRSIDDFEDHISFVDRRKLPPHDLHSLRDEIDLAHGTWRRSGLDCRITLPQQRLLEKLHDLVIYHNVIFITQNDLSKKLGVSESNLIKKLKTLTEAKQLIIHTSRGNIRTGEMKLILNPRLIFRGSDVARERYIQEWYRPTCTLQSSEPITAGSFETTSSCTAAV